LERKNILNIFYIYFFYKVALLKRPSRRIDIPEDLIFYNKIYYAKWSLFAGSLTCKNILLKNAIVQHFINLI